MRVDEAGHAERERVREGCRSEAKSTSDQDRTTKSLASVRVDWTIARRSSERRRLLSELPQREPDFPLSRVAARPRIATPPSHGSSQAANIGY